MKSHRKSKPGNTVFKAPRIKHISEYKFPGTSHLEKPLALPSKHSNEIPQFGRFPVIEPSIHSVEHHLTHLKPSNSMRAGAILLSRLTEDTMQQAGTLTSLPKDPFKFVTSQNIKALQKGMHGIEIVYAAVEGMHLAHTFDVNPWIAGSVALSAASTSNYLGRTLGNYFLPLPHELNVIKSFGQVCGKSSVIGTAILPILEAPLNYYSLRKNYSPTVSAASSGIGAISGIGSGILGLSLIDAGLVPTPASPFLISMGLITVYFSGDISKNVALTHAKYLKQLVDGYGLFVEHLNVKINEPKQVEFKSFKPPTVPLNFTSQNSLFAPKLTTSEPFTLNAFKPPALNQ